MWSDWVPPSSGGEGLHRDPGQIVERLLWGQRDTRGLGVETHPGRALVLGPVALGHEPVPDATSRAELGDLLEELGVAVEEEAEPRREVIDSQPTSQGVLDVGHPVGDRERELLDRRAAGFADVIPGDRDRVPAWQLPGAELDRIGDESHRGRRREQELLLSDELLEDVVLGRALEGRPRDARLLRRDDVHRPDRRSWRVDRHRGADPVERQPGEQDLHVGEAADRHAARPELAFRLG